MPLLALDDVSARHETGAQQLVDVTWALEAGEHHVVLGPNGSGKTTFMHLASSYRHPTTGTASFFGHELGRVDIRTLRPRMGVVTPAMAEVLPMGNWGREMVITAKHAAMRRWDGHEYTPADEARADALLAQVGCTPLARRPCASFSQGEWQRVQIARALMSDPEVLLLDEPAAALDLPGREDLIDLIESLATERPDRASVLVTHHVEEIPRTATHVLLLRDGHVVAQGPIEEALTADALSEAMGRPLQLSRHDERWFARSIGS